jgi:hypothetical protein
VVRCENAWPDSYQEVTTIPSVEKTRDFYRMLLDAFRTRLGEAKRTLVNAEYTKILLELRFNPKATLNSEQAVRVSETVFRLFSRGISSIRCDSLVGGIGH